MVRQPLEVADCLRRLAAVVLATRFAQHCVDLVSTRFGHWRATTESALRRDVLLEEQVLATFAEWSTLLSGSGRSRQLLMSLTPDAIRQAVPALHAALGES